VYATEASVLLLLLVLLLLHHHHHPCDLNPPTKQQLPHPPPRLPLPPLPPPPLLLLLLTVLSLEVSVSTLTCLRAEALSKNITSSSTLLEASMVRPYSSSWATSLEEGGRRRRRREVRPLLTVGRLAWSGGGTTTRGRLDE